MRSSWFIVLLAVSLILVPAAWNHAQETDPEPVDIDLVERTERRLTAIDITIRPKKKTKAELPELTVDDLEVVVMGKRRVLRHVDRVCSVLPGTKEPASAETQAAETPSSPPPTAPVVSKTLVFYLVHSHLTMQGQATALQMARDLIEEMVQNGEHRFV